MVALRVKCREMSRYYTGQFCFNRVRFPSRSVTLAHFAIIINYGKSVFIFALRTSVESYSGYFSVVKRDKAVSACFIKVK
jgi:hypothetical protein